MPATWLFRCIIIGTKRWSVKGIWRKTTADELDSEPQACKSHMMRNTETFIEHLEPKVEPAVIFCLFS